MSSTKPVSKYPKNECGLFVCTICGETKLRSNTMYYHMKSHAGIKEYVCDEPGCDSAFIQKSGLTQHKRQAHNHLTDDSSVSSTSTFACPICFHDSAKTKANLLIHIGRKHGTGWIPKMELSGICTGDCNSKILSSETAYAYHATSCFIDKAPKELQEFVRPLLAGKKKC